MFSIVLSMLMVLVSILRTLLVFPSFPLHFAKLRMFSAKDSSPTVTLAYTGGLPLNALFGSLTMVKLPFKQSTLQTLNKEVAIQYLTYVCICIQKSAFGLYLK